MVKRFSILLALAFAVALLSQGVSAQSEWVGEYFYGEDGGETAGGTKIYIAHTIKITEKDGKFAAHIYSQGFQTSRDLYADVEVEGSSMKLIFREKGPDHVIGEFKRGDLLLMLEKADRGLTTTWANFKPVVDSNLTNGIVRFKKVTGWKRLNVAENKVSLELPENLSHIRHTERFFISREESTKLIEVSDLEVYGGSSEDSVVRLEIFHTKLPEKLSKTLQLKSFSGTVRMQENQIGNYLLTSIYKNASTFRRQSWYLTDDARVLVFTAVTKSDNASVFEKFFNSVSIASSQNGAANRMRLRWKPPAEFRSGNLETTDRTARPNGDRPGKQSLQIIDRFRPSYTKQARRKSKTGMVRLKITLKSSGLVKDVEKIESLSKDLDNQAIVAAYQLIYFPAVRKGRAISVRKTIIYKFSIY